LIFPGDASVRQQLNDISGYIDAGTVYGNSEDLLKALLDPDSGKRHFFIFSNFWKVGCFSNHNGTTMRQQQFMKFISQ